MKGRFRQWYHTSGDTTDKSDSTQFKRMVVISAATAVFPANAGPAECERMMGEVGSRIWGGSVWRRAKLRNFIDGKRNILDIRNAASAEYGPLRIADIEAT